jgi:hypothetical protein
MALTPGLYVPQGQVGTGAAYVHQIKDRSGQLEAIAKAAEKQRVDQEKQMAKLKGFDYGKVVDPKMKEHISKKYKEGLTSFAQIVAKGGDINNTATDEGIAYSTWQNQIKDEADTAALAEVNKERFLTSYSTHPELYDTDIASAVLEDYEAATTPDDKLRATQNLDPLHLKQFNYNKWIQEEIEPAKTDREILDLGEDITEYQNVYNKKLEEIPSILATKPGYRLAEVQWKKRKEKGEEGFDQVDFQTFLEEQVAQQKIIRESKSESPASKGNNITIVMPGEDAKNAVTTPTSNVQGMAINLPDLKEAFEGKSPTHQAFWAAGTGNVPKLVLKGKGNDPAAYGLDSTVAEADGDDPNGIKIKGDMLWKFRIPKQGQVFQPQDKAELSTNFKNANYFDENGKVTGGEPADMYEDQLGNLWLDLTDEKGSARHIIVAVGGYTQTYKDQYGNLSVNPLKAVAEKNQAAIEKSLGVKFSDFANKYFYNNMNITK